ncbi:MAG: hypothetical protein ACOCXZ_03055 [Chloroflexota bacterium]
MSLTYIVTIDRDDDDMHAGSGEVITPQVLALRWHLGLDQPDAPAAAPGCATITVRSPDGTFSPERGGPQPGQQLRIRCDDGTLTRTLFTGMITHIEPVPGAQGTGLAVLHAVDRVGWLAENPAQPGTWPEGMPVRADMLIDRLLDGVRGRRDVLRGFCLIDAPESIVDATLIFGTDPIVRSLQAGRSTFLALADPPGDATSALQAVAAAAATERGRFFFNRLGQAVFFNRHHALTAPHNGPPALVLADDMLDLRYGYGEAVVNRVVVRMTPRQIGPADSLLWSLGAPVRLRPGLPRRMVARFHAADGQPVSALALTDPQPGTHFSAAALPDGSGGDRTDRVTVELRARDSRSVELLLRAGGRADVYLTALDLRGTPLSGADPALVIAEDGHSIARYGLRTLVLDLPMLTDVEQADAIAHHELAIRAVPRGTVRTVTLDLAQHPAALALTLSDRVQVTESQTGHSATYHIVAEIHTVDQGGLRHRVEWLLQPAQSDRFFIIDQHAPDSGRMLIPY